MNQDQELGQPDENQQEIPAGQANEAPEAGRKETETDPLKKLQDELCRSRIELSRSRRGDEHSVEMAS